jgi:serine/threonine protein kinase
MSETLREEQVFCEALEISSLAERMAYLDHACGDDLSLRKRVLHLLQADRRAGAFLERPLEELSPTAGNSRRPNETVGVQIGPYKLLRELGEGGMGTVFLAEQHEPVKRTVALKLLKPGMDSRQILRRVTPSRRHVRPMVREPLIQSMKR